MQTLSSIQADIVALDANDEPVLLVEIKARTCVTQAAVQQIEAYLRAAKQLIPYAMLIDRQTVRIHSWDGRRLSAALCELPTASALSFYDSEFETKEIYEDYFTALVEAWLRDVAYQWKSDHPPFYEQLEGIGLADRLRSGTTLTEFNLSV